MRGYRSYESKRIKARYNVLCENMGRQRELEPRSPAFKADVMTATYFHIVRYILLLHVYVLCAGVPDGATRPKTRSAGWSRAGWELNTLDG